MNSEEERRESAATRLLRAIGMQPGDSVLDFGCGSGNYTIPAAEIVGKEGRIYALDKDQGQLDTLERRAASRRLRNVGTIQTRGELDIPLEDESVDVILLYDVLHGYYFPRASDRKRLLSEAHRVLRPGGLLSTYPTHLGGYMGLTVATLEGEVEGAGFQAAGAHSGMLVHDGITQQGTVLNFKKAKATR